LFSHDAFELAQPYAILIGELVVRLGVQRFPFFERLPEGALPMMTVSIARNRSNANWS